MRELIWALVVGQSLSVMVAKREAVKYARKCLNQTGRWWDINTIGNEVRIRRVR